MAIMDADLQGGGTGRTLNRAKSFINAENHFSLSDDEALIGETLSEIGHRKGRVAKPKNPNQRQPSSSLRARDARPCDGNPKPRNELSPSHTSSPEAECAV
jgi:hypothetical protein